jgi:hypothetical protein
MFIAKEICHYSTMEALFDAASRTGVHPNPEKPAQIFPGGCISDSLLYTQSNGRILLGQDAEGRMHFVCAPGKRDFALPTLTSERDQLMGAHPGMYYQADMALLLGKIKFSLILESGAELSLGGEGTSSCYLDYFLPATTATRDGLTLTSMSLAPMLEPGVKSALSPLPLPGPSGAIHALHIKNGFNRTFTANAHLSLSESFLTQYQFDMRPMDRRAHRPFQAEWDENMLFMWRPDVSAMVQAQGFTQTGNPGMPGFWREIELAPGEEITLTCFVVISAEASDLRPALAMLYRHTALEWINITADFWAHRLGSLKPLSNSPLEKQSMDFHMRSVIDNFNCLQMNNDGDIVIHWQGAPSHNSGRFWGIDAEPTALSVLYCLPEYALPILRYLVDRNTPAYSLFPDHSTPIFMAPLIIAAKYSELTGDMSLFLREAHVAKRLVEDSEKLLALRHPSGLVPSRYSSDGHVFNRYDFGANCKAYYVFSSLGPVLASLGRADLKDAFTKAAGMLKEAVRGHMCVKGPFGQQIRGGSNMGEHEPFYLRDDTLYYDGEDSSSCLAPLYGILDFHDPLWQNYHRFSRSLFCTNYDPEAGALRWFARGGAIDGTALISGIGGSVSRQEMAARLQNMFDMGCDDTGSLFWWPKAKNWVRGLTRCSQGQGAWIFQHMEQWLGLRLNAAEKTLSINLQGLYTGYEWKGANIGGMRFDIRVQEGEDTLSASVTNLNDTAVTLRIASRPAGCAFSGGECHTFQLAPYGTADVQLARPAGAALPPVSIPAVENAVYAPDGPVLGTALFEQPFVYHTEPNVFAAQLVLLSGPEELRGASINVSVPAQMEVKPKEFALVDEFADEGFGPSIVCSLGDIPANSRKVIPIYLSIDPSIRCHGAWMARSPFAAIPQTGPAYLAVCSDSKAELGDICARVTAEYSDGRKADIRLVLPVRTVTGQELDQLDKDIFGGQNVNQHPRL